MQEAPRPAAFSVYFQTVSVREGDLRHHALTYSSSVVTKLVVFLIIIFILALLNEVVLNWMLPFPRGEDIDPRNNVVRSLNFALKVTAVAGAVFLGLLFTDVL